MFDIFLHSHNKNSTNGVSEPIANKRYVSGCLCCAAEPKCASEHIGHKRYAFGVNHSVLIALEKTKKQRETIQIVLLEKVWVLLHVGFVTTAFFDTLTIVDNTFVLRIISAGYHRTCSSVFLHTCYCRVMPFRHALVSWFKGWLLLAPIFIV